MLQNKLRIFLRKILGYLTKQTIDKHNIKIILVAGYHEPTLIKERVYSLLNQHINSRRSLESYESEFSLPLSVFGLLKYPLTYLGWLRTIIQVYLRLIYLNSYPHVLILQIKPIDDEIFKFWTKVLQPDLLITTGLPKHLYKYTAKIDQISLSEKDGDMIIDGKFPKFLINKLSSALGLNISSTDINLQEDIYSRLRILGGVKGTIIIDSRHLYHPPKLKNVIELARSFKGHKYIFSKIKSDFLAIPSDIEIVKKSIPSNFGKNTVFIFRGDKSQYINEIKQLAKADLGV